MPFTFLDRGVHAGGHGGSGGCALSTPLSSAPGLMQGESGDLSFGSQLDAVSGEGSPLPPRSAVEGGMLIRGRR